MAAVGVYTVIRKRPRNKRAIESLRGLTLVVLVVLVVLASRRDCEVQEKGHLGGAINGTGVCVCIWVLVVSRVSFYADLFLSSFPSYTL